MQALANMLNTFLEDLLLITYACAIGGLVWSVLLLKPWKHRLPAESGLASLSLALMRWGALGMALVQLARLVTHAWLLAEAFQRWPFPDYVQTLQCQAGLSRALLAVSLATQPPAIDMADQQATWAELSEVFRPKLPRLLAPASVEAGRPLPKGAPRAWR